MRVASTAGIISVALARDDGRDGGRGDRHEAAPHAVEVGTELVGAAVALRGLLEHRVRDDERERVGHVRRERLQRRGRVGDVLHRDRDRRVALERHAAGEHLVEHDAERVDVGLRADAAAARLLGREVLRRADDRADLGHLRIAGVRDAEVGHLDAPVVAHEHVVRLDVAVHDAVLVRVAQPGEHLHGDRDGALGRELAPPSG